MNDTVESKVEKSGGSKKRRLLIVDDSHDCATTMAILLKLLGNETCVAHSGLEAIQLAPEFNPHAIIMDIGMPGMDGYECAKLIRQEKWGQEVMLVALTGWSGKEDRDRAMEAGFDLHLVKPVETRVLEKMFGGVKSR